MKKLYLFINTIFLASIPVLQDLYNQISCQIHSKIEDRDFVYLYEKENFMIHTIKIKKSSIEIQRFKSNGKLLEIVSLNLIEYLDVNFDLTSGFFVDLLRILYSFGDNTKKYVVIDQTIEIYKIESAIYNFLEKIETYTDYIDDYDESKSCFLKYEKVLKNNYVFKYLTYEPDTKRSELYVRYYDKLWVDLCITIDKNKFFIFTIELSNINLDFFLKEYYNSKYLFSNVPVESLIRFNRYFKTENICTFNIFSRNLKQSTESIVVKKKRSLFARNIVFDIKSDKAIFNDRCYYSGDLINKAKGMSYIQISNSNIKEIEFFSDLFSGFYKNDLIFILKMMNAMKGTDLYILLLNRIFKSEVTGRKILLIEALYNMTFIDERQIMILLNNRNKSLIRDLISKIIIQINCYKRCAFYNYFNFILYLELVDILNMKDMCEQAKDFFDVYINLYNQPEIHSHFITKKKYSQLSLSNFFEEIVLQPNSIWPQCDPDRNEPFSNIYYLIKVIVNENRALELNHGLKFIDKKEYRKGNYIITDNDIFTRLQKIITQNN